MHDAEIGWIAAIIIGGLAGWLAEMFMKSGTGVITNIALGVVGVVSQFPVRNLWRRARWVARLSHCWVRRGLYSDLCVARN
jgi:uncharacterized membrane protein YeaQ/YmgE (transglycosylase-associated protein family)